MAMRVLNYEDAKKSVLLTLMSSDYRVPMIMGDRGCGKTSMAEDIANEMGGNLVSIDANVLKEGEIGGIPHVMSSNSNNNFSIGLTAGITRYCNNVKRGNMTLQDNINDSLKRVAQVMKSINGDEDNNEVMVYSVHHKLQECLDLYNENPDVPTILFIDELNRCDAIVKRELMNLILNREINGFKLPPNTKVVAACNPSSDFEPYRDTDYAVEDADEAVKDRFRYICMKSDITSWMKWGLTLNENGETNIDNQVIEYLVDREELLNNIQTSTDDIKTSPRSWEFVSNTYRTFMKLKKSGKGNFSENDLLNAIAGDISLNIASDFISFLEDNKNPLIKPEQIFGDENFKNEKLSEETFGIIAGESMLRKHVLVHNCYNYVKRMYEKEINDPKSKKGTKFSKKFLVTEKLFIEVISKAIKNADIMYSLLLDLRISNDVTDSSYLKHLLDLKDINIINAYTKLNQAY